MIPRIKKLTPLPDYHLLAEFDDGRSVDYDVSDDIKECPGYDDLINIYGLFRQARLDTSRTVVVWNDYIDLPSDAIYEYGDEVRPSDG